MFWDKLKGDGKDPDYPKLPLDLRLGAIISVDPAQALLFGGADLTVPLPGDDLVTDAVSASAVFGLTIVRAYARLGETTYMIQFNCNTDLAVNDVTLFYLTQEIYPQSEGDWDTWLGGHGLIGGPDLNAPNGKTYQRDWGDGDQADPVALTEKIYVDPKASPRVVEHKMMLYSRETGDFREYCLLSSDAAPDSAQGSALNSALIRAWIGVDIPLPSLKVY
jgi:hypothetical protein